MAFAGYAEEFITILLDIEAILYFLYDKGFNHWQRTFVSLYVTKTIVAVIAFS